MIARCVATKKRATIAPAYSYELRLFCHRLAAVCLVAEIHLILAGRILRADGRNLRIAALQGDFKREGGAVAV